MKPVTHCFFGITITLATLTFLSAEEPKTTVKPASPEDLLKLTQPGPEHERLVGYAGIWDVELKMGAGARAMVSQGSAENLMLVGNRFLQMNYQTKGGAGAIDGVFHLGFDRRHQQFALTAMDSFGTYFVTAQGKSDEKTGKIKLMGKDDDPQMNAMGLTKEFAFVVDLRSADEYAVEIWFVDTRTAARKEFKYMEYTFRRKKI